MSNANFAIILTRKRELVALLCLPGVLIVVWLFLKVPRVCLQLVIVFVVFLIILNSIASSFQPCDHPLGKGWCLGPGVVLDCIDS